MRVLAIRGQNLASLARSFEVELARGALANVGLFAITGPVGAGKSTLLDAMCLALFDRTPRLSGRGGTAIGDQGQDEGDWLRANDPRTLLRRDAAEGFAEVDFVGRDGLAYRARWSVRRARRRRDGRVQDQELVLQELGRDVVVASGRRTEVLAAIEQRLGLDFQQFCRSVLLAQGEFHAFLRAPANERAKLLETLTDAGIYRDLSKAAHERRRASEQRLALLRGQVEQLALLSADARASLEREVQRLDAERATCEVGIELAQRYVTWHGRAEQMRREESEAVVALREAQDRDREAAPRRDLLRRRQLAVAALPRFELAVEARAAAAEATRQVASAERLLAEGGRAVASRLAALQSLLRTHFGGRVAHAGDDVPSLVQDLPRWRPTLERFARAEADGARLAAVLPRATEAFAAAERHEAELGSQARDVAARSDRAAQALAAAEHAVAAADPDALEAERRRLDAARADVEQLATLVEEWRRSAEVRGEAESALAAATRDVAAATAAATRARAAARDAAGAAAAAQATLQHAERHHGLAALRAELVDGVPCPLCGAHEHPLAAEAVPDLAAARAAAQRAQDLATAARDAESRAAAKAEAAAQQRDRDRAAAAAADAALRYAASRVVVPERSFAAPSQAARHVAERRAHLAAEVDRLGQLERRVTASNGAFRAAAQEFTNADRARREHERAMAAASTKRGDAAAELARLRSDAERAMQALAEARGELDPACDGLVGGVDAVLAMRGDRAAALATMHAEHGQLDAARRDLERHETALLAARQRLAEREAARQRAEQDLQKALVVHGIDEADVAAAVELGPEALALENKELQQLAEDVARARTVLQERARLRRAHEHQDRPSLDAAEAAGALEQARAARGRVDAELAQARGQLAADDRERRRLGELEPLLARAERDVAVWSALDELIGSSTGDAFAVFAQGLTLDLLLVEANRRLEELARRYRLERTQDGGLDFVVVDLDMGGARRSLWSLSGGETFLVSLALALALATLAAPRSRVETLFLDEGFGTLDAQNLEIALAALDSLQATGCQVGVISHVDGFAERIGAVVEVRPEGAGKSCVSVAGR